MSSFKTVLIALMIGLMPTMAFAGSALTDAQKTEVEAVVRELLTKKEPEIIIKAAEAAQGKMEKAASEKGQENITKYQQQLNNDPASPVAGNPKGDVTVVEFFDYSCGYCKMAQAHVEKLLGEDKNVRFVFKEFAILGPASVTASQAALASAAQGKYLDFHNALMKSKAHLDEGIIFEIASEVGLNVDKLKKDMKDDKIAKEMKDTHDLADALSIHGTPSFIIGGKLYPGALPYEQLKIAIDEARKAKK